MIRSALHGNLFRSRFPIISSLAIASSSSSLSTRTASSSPIIKHPEIAPNQSDSQPLSTVSTSPEIITSLSSRVLTPKIISSLAIRSPIASSSSSLSTRTASSSPIIKHPEIAPNQSDSQPLSTVSTSPEIITSLSSRVLTPKIIKPNFAHSRTYVRFPPMIGSPDKPIAHANFAEAENFPDNFVTPESAVVEIKFAPCRNPDPTSRRPQFKVHNLRSSYVNGKGEIVNLNRIINKNNERFYKFLMGTARKMILLDLAIYGIDEAELEQVWWPETGNAMDFWATALLKHSRFSLDEAIDNYASKTYDLAYPIINGTEDQPGLGEFLETKKFYTGKYHKVANLMPALKDFFGVDVYPTFVGHGGYHPSLLEVGLLTNKECNTKIHHPMSTTIPPGEFLMRRFR